MYNHKARGIFHFGSTWRYDNKPYTSKPSDWVSTRNRLANDLLQINKAKTSFAYEMTWPLECKVVCLDRHILRLFGQDPESSPKPKDYDWMERYWVRQSNQEVSCIARCICR